MKKIIFLFLSSIICNVIFAQQHQTFDITTFIQPAGWGKEIKDFAVSFVKTDAQTQGWCRVTVYKSINSSGNSVTDFNSEWNSLITKNYPDATLPTPEATIEDGWTSQAGVAKFQFNNQESYGLLTTVSGYEKEVSIVVLMNDDEFMPTVETFLVSLDLIKPVVSNKMQVPTQSTQPIPQSTNNPSNSGISISTTNFDDGWVAQPFANWVMVANPNVEVYIYYVEDFSTNYSGKIEPEDHYWSTLIPQRFNIQSEERWSEMTYPPIHYKEGNAVSKETGKSSFIAMDVYFSNGGATVILAVATSKDILKQKFAHPRDLEKMLGYNKFAVCEKDLIGTWEESSGSAVNMYNVNTGAYAGMNTASSANKFVFKIKGQYESAHSGASGMVGSMQFYSQKYNGQSTYANWDVTLTKRFKDKTEIFWAQFEAVRGGRVLHLTNKEASGVSYHLVKTQ
jgi:hypothetical protein